MQSVILLATRFPEIKDDLQSELHFQETQLRASEILMRALKKLYDQFRTHFFSAYATSSSSKKAAEKKLEPVHANDWEGASIFKLSASQPGMNAPALATATSRFFLPFSAGLRQALSFLGRRAKIQVRIPWGSHIATRRRVTCDPRNQTPWKMRTSRKIKMRILPLCFTTPWTETRGFQFDCQWPLRIGTRVRGRKWHGTRFEVPMITW